MYKSMLARLQQGHRTMKYPAGDPPPMPDRFRGRPLLAPGKCEEGCKACIEACPTTAIGMAVKGGDIAREAIAGRKSIDLGRCLFCGDCREACPKGALSHSGDYRLSVSRREDLIVDLDASGKGEAAEADALRLASALRKESLRLFGRSLRLREVSAGGCNACECDVNVLGTIGWDLGRFGIQMVASPRHADGLLVTGPVTKNMELALRKTWDAVAEPKILIAVGSCAISGGPYHDSPEACGGVDQVLKDAEGRPLASLYVPGCPPHPLTILDGLLRILGRIK